MTSSNERARMWTRTSGRGRTQGRTRTSGRTRTQLKLRPYELRPYELRRCAAAEEVGR